MKTLLFLIGLGLVIGIFASRFDIQSKKYVVKYVQIVQPTPTPLPKTGDILKFISDTFESEGKQVVYQAISVAKNESGWRPDAKGWNCHYEGKSMACKPQDRENAWSVDCGLMQINVKGKECPSELLDIKTNILKAYAMYKRRLWQPWVSARNLGYVN